MICMGGKFELSKKFVPELLEHRNGRAWVEPFVGGGNVIDKVSGIRIGADVNKWTIQALRVIRDYAEELPRDNIEFTEEDYEALRLSDECWFKGFAGFSYSYCGKWLGGWARGIRNNRDIDFVSRAYISANKQRPNLNGVQLLNRSYDELEFRQDSLIYCDPPYIETTKYATGQFDHNKFWEWCRNRVYDGHKVFVSEYTAPKDFSVFWEKACTKPLGVKKGGKRKVVNERIFTL